jgi:serine/threonine protein kinase
VAREGDRVCDEFEAAWRRGERPRLEDAVGDADAPARPWLLRELLRVELAYRRGAGERPVPDQYAQCAALFPDAAALIAEVFREASETTAPPPPRTWEGSADEKSPAAASDWPRVPGYEILAELGRGGMGIVYKARQLGFNRVVALKTLSDSAASLRARFLREARSVAELNHPHIVGVHAFGEYAGGPYFAMEFMPGGSLTDRLAARPLPPRQAARLVARLADAVQYAHDRDIIHRDLKPANVLLAAPDRDADPDGPALGLPKVADFGLAKRLDTDTELTDPGAIMGTASYMAPEQARGDVRQVGRAADVWSLGAILYEVLSGRPPFKGATRDLTIAQVLTDEPPRPTEVRPSIPLELEAVCLKCLEKEPDKRYPSAGALSEDLEAFLSDGTMVVRPLSEWERQCRWANRIGYELVEVAGWSPLGLVYVARQLSLQRPVVLKTVSPRAGGDPLRLARFRTEAEVAARLDHPNIQKIYDLGERDGQAYLSQEHVDGGTLADRLTGQPLAARDAAVLVEALARAAHCAHQKGIIHNDLRPFNVLLTADGVPKVTGLGLARLLRDGGQTEAPGARRVFSNYMAPEQATADAADSVGPAADVHALGAILYELLTGQPPFLARTVAETLEQIRTRPPRPPSELNPELHPLLDAICLRCLAKDPAARYPGAGELAEELRRVQRWDPQRTQDVDLVPGYALEEELGRGGTTVVYRARQASLDRVVALKIFRDNFGPILAANRAVGRLAHPNLVQVIDCGEREGLLYVAEEYVDGQSLDRKIAGKPRPAREAAELVETLARVLEYVHQSGIVHRNLKPRVVLLTALGVPKVSSFDLALLTDRGPPPGEEEGLIRGTPNYLAPEQALGDVRRIGRATDVHGLGTILYELLTGRPPFAAADPVELVRQVIGVAPPPPRQLAAGVPAALEAVCLRCLEKDPARRYPTAGDLADALRAFQKHGRSPDERAGWLWRVWRWFGGGTA